MTNLAKKLVTVTEIQNHLRIFIVLLFFTFSLLAQNNGNPQKSSETPVERESHRIYFQTGYGYGNLENANYEISKQYNTKSGIAYSALNQGDYIPIQITEDIAPTAYIADIIISNSILRSNHFNHNLNYAYLQFEFSKGF